MEIAADPVQNSQTVPLVVLVSEDTVSFGEVFSGVLKDSGRAQIVGESTLGNVEVLHGYDLADGSRVWIAEETFTPLNSQANWEVTGIVPDVQAYADWDTFTFENDPSIAAALNLLGH
jgi:C-terminal processing protease CtpA/Prc